MARDLSEALLDIREHVPNLIQEQLGVRELPFPPGLIESITDSEVLYINDCFQYEEVGRYDVLERLYYHLNRHFVEKGASKLAAGLVASTRRMLPPDVPLAPVLLLLGGAYMSEHDAKPRHLRGRSARAAHKKRLQTHVRKPLQDAVEASRTIPIPEGLSRNSVTDALSRAMDEVDKVIGAYDQKDGWQDFVFGRDVPRSFASDASGERIYQLGDGLRGFLEQTWRPYGAKKLSRELLKKWRVPVTENALRHRKRRRKRGAILP